MYFKFALVHSIQWMTIFIFIVVGFSSCKVEQKSISPYFHDSLAHYPLTIPVQNPPSSRIQKEDLLGITVSSLNKESNDILNFANINSFSQASLPGKGGGSQPIGYTVDSSGYISMAFIGKVKVEGLTLEMAQEKIRTSLQAFLKETAVNIRFLNHKFVVLGEFTNVGTYNLSDDRTTLIEALATAGDLTVYAKRDSITIIRNLNGKREIGKVSLINRDIFASPYFYLRNGDVIYAQPLAEKTVPVPPDNRLRQIQVLTGIIGAVVVAISLFTRIF